MQEPSSSNALHVESLLERIDQLQVIAEFFPAGICMFDRHLNTVVCNTRLKEMLEYPAELFSNGNPKIEDLFRFNAERGEYGPGDVDEHVRKRIALVKQRVEHVYERTRPNGMILEVRGVPLDGGGFLTTYVDVTEQRQKARQISVLIDNFPGGISMFDKHLKMVVCNRRLREMLEYPDALFANGNPSLEDLFRFNARRGEYGPGDVEEHVRRRMARVLEQRAHEYERPRPNGTILEVRGIPITDGGFVTTYLDVTENRSAQAHIAHMAHHDTLTGLPNRALLQDRLGQALAAIPRGGNPVAVLYLDLDRFKPVNDRYGHAVGDALLKAVAERLSNEIRPTDTAARIGGDEFIIVQTGIRTYRDAEVLATRLVAAMARDFVIGERTLQIGASIGVALAPDHGVEPDELIRRSDQALYEAKSAGRGNFRMAHAEAHQLSADLPVDPDGNAVERAFAAAGGARR